MRVYTEAMKERNRLYYQRNKEKYLEYNKAKRLANPVKTMLYDIKSRCGRSGIDFNLTEEDIVVPEYCPILGIKLEKGTDTIQKQSPSVDRINPELGYTKGNVQVVSVKANAMKSNATPEELRMFAKWVLRTFPEESYNG